MTFRSSDGYLCLDKACSIVNTNFTVKDGDFFCNKCTIDNNKVTITPPACSYTDTSISIQKGEVLPFRRGMELASSNAVKTASSCTSADDGKIIEESMQCTFKIYKPNGELTASSVFASPVPCRSQAGTVYADKVAQAREGAPSPGFITSLNYAKTAGGVYAVPFTADYSEYGEYKVSLDEVRYKVCGEQNKEPRLMNKRVCQVNFAFSKPYFLQKGAQSMKMSDALDDFYMMDGDKVPSFSDKFLKDTDTVTYSKYDGGSKLSQLDALFAKYDKANLTTVIK